MSDIGATRSLHRIETSNQEHPTTTSDPEPDRQYGEPGEGDPIVRATWLISWSIVQLLRIRSPDGSFRIEVQTDTPGEEFALKVSLVGMRHSQRRAGF